MQIALGLYPKMTALDAMGPYAVLSQLPDTDLVLCAERAGRLSDDNNRLHLEVEATFADVPTPDVLLVPGGFVTRAMANEGEPIVEWIRAAHPTTTWTTSVCTGALLLGAAGVLEGIEATTHWCAYDELASFGATPTAERVVRRGKVITGAGVSAGIDMALTLAGLLQGDVVAEAIQLGIEYDPQPPYDAGSPDKASADVRALVTAVMGHD
jgi:transcriptional regulator GlxA family with amidase domain